MVRYVNISIPNPLYDELSKALEGGGYCSPSEYIIFITRKALPDLQSEKLERKI